MARFIKRRKKRIPLAASAARSQQDRDTFFGGKKTALAGSKSTRGGRPVGRDRRSAAAVASASAPIVANRDSKPVEKEMEDKIESAVSSLKEPSDPITSAYVSGKDIPTPGVDSPLPESPTKTGPSEEMDEITRSYMMNNETPDTPGVDSPLPESATMTFSSEDDDITKAYMTGKDIPTPGVDSPLPFSDTFTYLGNIEEGEEKSANQSFKGMDSAGQTVLEDAPAKPKGFLQSMMERFPKAAAAMKAVAENRALNEMLKKEMDRAKMSKKASDFLGYMEEKPVEKPSSRFFARGKN